MPGDLVADLCRRFKQRYPDKDIWLWTGYRHEEVQHLPLLQDVDVLIDGSVSRGQTIAYRGFQILPGGGPKTTRIGTCKAGHRRRTTQMPGAPR